MGTRELDWVRKFALSLPEVNERLSHGAPCFFVRDKRPMAYFHDEDFRQDGRIALWCPAPPGAQEELVGTEPERFFAPTPSTSGLFGHWVGVYLDASTGCAVDWEEVAAILEDAYRMVAPQRLIAQLD